MDALCQLGEFEQGRPLLELLKTQYPEIKIVLTFFSPSGYEDSKELPGADAVFYLPMDSKVNAKKMIGSINPSLVLWVKYEYWFYYLQEFKATKYSCTVGVGIFRNSQPFFKWYGGIGESYCQLTYFFVQNEDSEKLLAGIGIAGNVTVNGDTRFDRVIEIAERFEPLRIDRSFCGKAR